MLQLLWLIPAIPFAEHLGFGAFRPRAVAAHGRGRRCRLDRSLGADLAGRLCRRSSPAETPFTQVLWTWIDVAGFRPEIAFYLDALSLLMVVVVTFVSFLIHLYSAEFMEEDEGYARFFAYMNLFVASMVVLVLADNLLLLYLGWEGVGLMQLSADRLLVSAIRPTGWQHAKHSLSLARATPP